GAQMTYSVQDGPDRMNKCGLAPNTKEFVLRSAFNKGFSMNMRYFEVYKEDIDDVSLATTIQQASDSTAAVYAACNSIVTAIDHNSRDAEIQVYPNPAGNSIFIKTAPGSLRNATAMLVSPLGQLVYSQKITATVTEIRLVQLPPGVYFLTLERNGKKATIKIVRR
ncbi:MAG TPA: T9SS type A sorting domain-containing protein, partial [Flavisolibacter sp.]